MIEWRPIKGYEGYLVSNTGVIKSIDRYQENHSKLQFRKGIIKQQRIDGQGYLFTDIYKSGKPKTVRIHRFVAETFIPNPLNKPTVNHIDGNKKNNDISNLEWADYSEQNIHTYKNKLKSEEGIKKSISAMNKAQSKPVRCISTGEIFESASAGARSIGISTSRIMKVCREKKGYAGLDKNNKPLYWEYV